MVVELYKKKKVVENKIYINLYLKIGDKLVPINVSAIKDSDGEIMNKNDYSLTITMATELK